MMEGSHSGLVRMFAKHLKVKAFREFESLPLRYSIYRNLPEQVDIQVVLFSSKFHSPLPNETEDH